MRSVILVLAALLVLAFVYTPAQADPGACAPVGKLVKAVDPATPPSAAPVAKVDRKPVKYIVLCKPRLLGRGCRCVVICCVPCKPVKCCKPAPAAEKLTPVPATPTPAPKK